MRFVKVGAWVLFTLFLLAIAVALIGQNTESLTVTLFTYTSAALPKWVLLLGCLFLGALLASLFFIVELIILETKNIRLRRQNRLLTRALEEKNIKAPSLENTESQRHTKSIEEDDLSDV
jgi:uncharacterized integral membrane protein